VVSTWKNRLAVVAHIACLTPLVWLIWDYLHRQLTYNPIQAATLRTGRITLTLLVLTLGCGLVYRLTNQRHLLWLRRLLGLYTFFYASIHLLIFVGWDYQFDASQLYGAILEKRYALVGMAAFLILLALAVTSTRGWMVRLGKNWSNLHKLVYLAALLSVLHYFWLTRGDYTTRAYYGLTVLLLLLLRLAWSLKQYVSRMVRDGKISKQ
jgi:sulfoxide reductase heme-binding subunit YedZ